MKRGKINLLILITMLILPVLCLPACTSTIPTIAVAQTTAMTAESSSETTLPSILPLSSEDLGVEVGGSVYFTYGEASILLNTMGEPVSFSEAPSCLFEGTDKTYEFEDVAVYTITKKGVDLIDGIDLLTSRYTTRRGITVGSTKASILAAYGEPFSMDNDIVYLAELAQDGSAAALTFIMDGDVVVAVSIYSGSNSTAS